MRPTNQELSTIWNPEYECMSREQLQELQYQRLQMTLRWAYSKVPFYRELWDGAGVKPQDVRTLADLSKVPFIDKATFRAAHPYGLFAVPLEQVVRIHTSSGTVTRPSVMGYTKGDLNTWSELTARVATAGGARAQDVAQIAFGYGLPTGAHGFQGGLERIGVTVIPASTGNTKRQLIMMRDYRTTLLVCTPTYAMHLARAAEAQGVDFGDLHLRVGILGGQPWSIATREELERRMQIIATDNYGLSEVIGPGISGECWCQDGLHVNEDHFIVECIDPETGEAVSEGSEGELVFTSLTKEAVPVIRFRTGDLSSLNYRPCSCGRSFVRHAKVYARCDDMLVVGGVNVYPYQVEAVLERIEGVEPHYQIVLDREGALDRMEVQVEVSAAFFPDSMKKLVAFERMVQGQLQEELGLRPRVKLVEPKTLPHDDGKARRVVDNRPK